MTSQTTPCHVCATPASLTCMRCNEPACSEHLFDEEHLCLCTTCKAGIEKEWAVGRGPLDWPYPVRKPNPAWFPDGKTPEGLVIDGE